MSTKKFVFLSDRSLSLVADWVESNPKHPLAQLHSTLCLSLSYAPTVGEKFEATGYLCARKRYRASASLDTSLSAQKDATYIARDSVGRIILSMLKRHE